MANDITRLLKYYREEEVEHIDFFKHYTNILAEGGLEKSSFISTKFAAKGNTTAYTLFTSYFDKLKENIFKTFMPFGWRMDGRLPQVEKGKVLVYTLVACSDIRIGKIRSPKDLRKLIEGVSYLGRVSDPFFLYYIKFQTAPNEDELVLEEQIIAQDYGY